MEKSATPSSYAAQILQMLDEQRQTGNLCDVTVASNDDMTFNAHSSILAASSQLFRSKLSGQNVGQVMLDLGAKSIQMLLDVLYSGISTLKPEEVIDIRLIAQSFEMDNVIRLCDGVIEYDLPGKVKPDMVDQATNTENSKVKKFQINDFEDDGDLIEDEPNTQEKDPEYEPNKEMIKPRFNLRRKRGRPTGSLKKKRPAMKEAKQDLEIPASSGLEKAAAPENDLPEPRPDPSILVMEGVSRLASGPKTRSQSGISKLKPVVQNILTKVKESNSLRPSPAIRIMPLYTEEKKSQDNVRVNPGLIELTGDISSVEETLVVEDGEVNHAAVNESFNSIIGRMKHLHDRAEVEKLDIDSDEFHTQVSNSFTEILNQISQKEGDAQTVLGVSDENIKEWKDCKYCSQFKGKKKGRLDFHRKYCSSPYQCFLCYKPFLSELDLSHHKCSKIQQEIVCELCGKVLVNSNALKLHMKIHLDIKVHCCQFCGKRFIRKNHLDGHIRAVHTKERPYNCNKCTAKFALKGELNRHMLKHTTESPKYLCSSCGRAFYERYQLTSHLKSCPLKDSVKWKCSLCDKSFSSQNQLINHSNVCSVAVMHYVERKQNPDGSVVLCIIPSDGTDKYTKQTSVPMEHAISEQHVIQIGTDSQVTIEDVLQNALTQTTEIQGVQNVLQTCQSDQVFQLQSLNNDTIGFPQLTNMQDLQTLQKLPLDRLLSEKIDGVHIIHDATMDNRSQVLQSSVDGQQQILQLASADGKEQILPDSQIQILQAAPIERQGHIVQVASVDGQILAEASEETQGQMYEDVGGPILQSAMVSGQHTCTLQGTPSDTQTMQFLQASPRDVQVKILPGAQEAGVLRQVQQDAENQTPPGAPVEGQHQLQASPFETQEQILQTVSSNVEEKVQMLQNVPVDAQNMQILQPPAPQDCDNMMEVDAVSSLQNSSNCLVHIQGGHIYTRSLPPM